MKLHNLTVSRSHGLTVLLSYCLTFLLSSCTAESLKEKLVNQEKQIETYIENLKNSDGVNVDTVYSNYGVYRVVFTTGAGEEATAGDSLTFIYQAFNFNTRVVYDSSGTTTPITRALNSADFITGLQHGLTGMQANEHSQILLTGEQAYGNTGMGILPAYTPVVFEVIMLKIKKNEK